MQVGCGREVSSLQETDLFNPIKELLAASGMEIYTEVPCEYGRADVVGIKDRLVTVVELKTSLTLQLIQQAYDRLYKANYVYIAVPHSKTGIARIVRTLSHRDGFGIIEVYAGGKYIGLEGANILIPARLCRKAKTDWARNIDSGYRWENNTQAGVNKDFYSPYQDMIRAVKRYISARNPEPVGIEDILVYVDQVAKHYVQPKASLFAALKNNEKDWCEIVKVGNKTCFRLKTA